jgi:hypothetical protein
MAHGGSAAAAANSPAAHGSVQSGLAVAGAGVWHLQSGAQALFALTVKPVYLIWICSMSPCCAPSVFSDMNASCYIAVLSSMHLLMEQNPVLVATFVAARAPARLLLPLPQRRGWRQAVYLLCGVVKTVSAYVRHMAAIH